MKKVTPLIIAAIFVLSILMVGFLGVRAAPFTEVILVQRLTIENQDVVNGQVVLRGGQLTYSLVWLAYPRTATDRNVRITPIDGVNVSYMRNNRGEALSADLTFPPRFWVTHTVDIWTTDGSNRTARVRILVVP